MFEMKCGCGSPRFKVIHKRKLIYFICVKCSQQYLIDKAGKIRKVK